MKIRALIMDVDGTLTDGGIYMGADGELMKKFNVKDGYGINIILPQLGIIPIVLTGRQSKIVSYRCTELGIDNIIQGSKNKKEDMLDLLKKLNITTEETAYIGDDNNDLECMQIVKYRFCPNDGSEEIKKIATYVSPHNGGEGAVRDIIEYIKEDSKDDNE